MMRHILGPLKRRISYIALIGSSLGESCPKNESVNLEWLVENYDVNMWTGFHVFEIMTGREFVLKRP
jgi:hypothetical protein